MEPIITLFLREIMIYLSVQKSTKISHNAINDIITHHGQCTMEWFSHSHHSLKKKVTIFILKWEQCRQFISSKPLIHRQNDNLWPILHLSVLTLNKFPVPLTLSRQKSLSYRNQSIDLFCKSMICFLYDRDLPHERVNVSLNMLGVLHIEEQHWMQEFKALGCNMKSTIIAMTGIDILV